MVYISSKLIAILSIIVGCILITRKKIMIQREYLNIGVALITVAPLIEMTIKIISHEKSLILPIIFFNALTMIPFMIILINKGRNTWDIMNSNTKTVIPIITNILKEKDIQYEEKEKAIFLKKDDSYIYYKKSLDTVNIDCKNMKDITIKEEFAEVLKRRVKEIKLRVFPISVFLYIGVGTLILLVDKYI